MANATQMIKIIRADYERLIQNPSASIVINGHTVKYDPNAIYLIEENKTGGAQKIMKFIELYVPRVDKPAENAYYKFLVLFKDELTASRSITSISGLYYDAEETIFLSRTYDPDADNDADGQVSTNSIILGAYGGLADGERPIKIIKHDGQGLDISTEFSKTCTVTKNIRLN